MDGRNIREHGIPLDLVEIGFLNGRGICWLRWWFRENYLAKIIEEMKRDRPYNICEAELKRSDPSDNDNIL